MSSVITIGEDGVVYEGNHQLMKRPKCGKWNRVGHQRLVNKVLVVAAEDVEQDIAQNRDSKMPVVEYIKESVKKVEIDEFLRNDFEKAGATREKKAQLR